LSTVFLFPGQGAQKTGMAAALLERSEIARELFSTASDILGFDLKSLCLNGPDSELSRTEYSQPALFVHSIAALRQLELEQPDIWEKVTHLAGLSLGEYTAVCAAGGFSFEAGVRLVRARGQAMQSAADAVPSGMSSILGVDQTQLEAICVQASAEAEFVKIANLLCPGNTAISGHLAALERAESLATAAGAMKTIRLAVAGAFHTELMRPAVSLLEEALDMVEFSETRIPIVSNVDAASHRAPDEIRQLLSSQVVSPVLWEDSLRFMLAAGITQFVEIGSGRVLAGTLKRIDRKAPCDNYGDA
jgi:[acyl-carrier-protein] S-malonyltransferase